MTASGAVPGPPICVLGMGRSGTSLTARALNLLGVDLGPSERMLEVNDWNPVGFWEQLPIMELNDEILTRLGGSYEEPPELPDGWHRDPGMSDLHERASELVAAIFPSDRRWGFKDPRTVMTLPFWRDVVGEMHYVICARDPFEVARLRGESERLMHELQRSTEALEAISTSRSWRLTAPLRRGARRLRTLG